MNIYIESASGNKLLATQNARNAVLCDAQIIDEESLHTVGDIPTIKTTFTRQSCEEGSRSRARRMNVEPPLPTGSIALGIHKSFVVYPQEDKVTFALAVSGFIVTEGVVKFCSDFVEIPLDYEGFAKEMINNKLPASTIQHFTGIDIKDKTKPLYETITGQSEVVWIQQSIEAVLVALVVQRQEQPEIQKAIHY